MKDSAIVEEVRRRRCEISERFGDDLRAYYEHLKQFQAQYDARLADQAMITRIRRPENGGGRTG